MDMQFSAVPTSLADSGSVPYGTTETHQMLHQLKNP